MKLHQLLLIVSMSSTLVGISGAGAFGEIRIHGSSTIFPIVQSAAETFEIQTGIHIELKGGGSENGIQALLDNQADLCMVSRDLFHSDPERLTAYTIGYDGIALIVNKAIGITEIGTRQVVDIYSGNVTNWYPLTGKDCPITITSKHDGHGTKTMFDMYFGLEGKVTSNAHLFHSNNVSIAMVSSDPNAIGYVSIGSAEHALELGLQLRILSLDGVTASSDNVASGRYPLRRAINLVTAGEPKPEAAEFIRFMKGPAGQQHVKQNHFVVLSGAAK